MENSNRSAAFHDDHEIDDVYMIDHSITNINKLT